MPIGRINRQIADEPRIINEIERFLDQGFRRLEQITGFVEAALIADLDGEVHQRVALGRVIFATRSFLDFQRFPIGQFSFGIIAGAVLNSGQLDEIAIGGITLRERRRVLLRGLAQVIPHISGISRDGKQGQNGKSGQAKAHHRALFPITE